MNRSYGDGPVGRGEGGGGGLPEEVDSKVYECKLLSVYRAIGVVSFRLVGVVGVSK